jgi:hypothetical protein
LSSRVVLFEATNVSILCSAVGKEGTDLLCYSITVELNDLLAHIRITSIDGPCCIAIVAGNIDLRSWHRAVKRGGLTFVGLEKSSFSKIDSVDCFDDSGNTVRRLRNSQ